MLLRLVGDGYLRQNDMTVVAVNKYQKIVEYPAPKGRRIKKRIKIGWVGSRDSGLGREATPFGFHLGFGFGCSVK